jgi:hypothetical protein
MDAVENEITSFRKASRHWNILLILLFDQLYGKTRSRKLGPIGMLRLEEN